MGLNARKPDFVACKYQRCRLACTIMQSDRHLCYSLFGKFSSKTRNVHSR